MKIAHVLVLLTALTACADPISPTATPAPAQPMVDTTAGYDALLKAHVDADGWVDYTALAAERGALDALVASLAEADPAVGSRDERLAHLINAYNAFTLTLILDADIPASITDLHEGKPWDVVRWNLGGKAYSLNQIEHELIRPVFNEPRIHWALVCAAYSCPPLRNEAYDAARLEEQLAAQESYVLSFDDPRYANRDGGGVRVTPLMDWYGEDFAIDGGDAEGYAAQRLRVAPEAVVGFLNYNWQLNDVANRPDPSREEVYIPHVIPAGESAPDGE